LREGRRFVAHREAAKRVRGMGMAIVDRRGGELARPGVELTPILPQRLDPYGALGRVEPAARRPSVMVCALPHSPAAGGASNATRQRPGTLALGGGTDVCVAQSVPPVAGAVRQTGGHSRGLPLTGVRPNRWQSLRKTWATN